MVARGVTAGRFLAASGMAAAVAVAVALSGPGQSIAAKTKAHGAPGAHGVQLARQQLRQHMAVPKFVAPGPAFNARAAHGKKVLMISLNDTDPFNGFIETAMKTALAKAGVKASDYADQGQSAQWVQGMNTAIADHVNLVALIGIDPGQLAPQIKSAEAHHIKVIDGQFRDPSVRYPGAFRNIPRAPEAYELGGELAVDQAVASTNGKANILVVTSNDIMPSRDVVTGIRKQLTKTCSHCAVQYVNVPFNNWATQGQSAVQSALVKDPKVTYVVPVFDSMVSAFVSAALSSSSVHNVHIATFNASPAEMKMLQQHNLITMDAGDSYTWVGWAFADQALRALTGHAPASTAAATAPVRAFTSANALAVGVPPVSSKGYGTFERQYERVWELTKK